MGDPTVSDFEPTEEAEVEKDVLGVFCDESPKLFKDVVQDDFAGLLLELCQFRDGS